MFHEVFSIKLKSVLLFRFLELILIDMLSMHAIPDQIIRHATHFYCEGLKSENNFPFINGNKKKIIFIFV